MGEGRREKYGLYPLTNTLLFQTKLFSYKTLTFELGLFKLLLYSGYMFVFLYKDNSLFALFPALKMIFTINKQL